MDGDLPAIEGFNDDEAARIRAALGLGDEVVAQEPNITFERPKSRSKSKPRSKRISDEIGGTFSEQDNESSGPINLPPAKLTKRDEREVNERLKNILLGGTGILGQAKPYLEMTEDEAKAISEPLSSYLVRNADTIPVARQVLENYDLLAIVIGVMAYVVRVYRDRKEELAEQHPQPTLVGSISEYAERNAGGSQVRETNIVPSNGGAVSGL